MLKLKTKKSTLHKRGNKRVHEVTKTLDYILFIEKAYNLNTKKALNTY